MGADASLGSGPGAAQNPARSPRTPRAMFKGAWEQHHDLLKNVVSLLATTGVTSAMGFAFWTVAARLFSQAAVGYGAATVSAMNLLATVGMFGLGTLLIGDLPKRRDKAGLISAALLASGLGSLLLAGLFIAVVPRLTTHFGDISGSPVRVALLCAGVALTAMTQVFDQATIGLLRGGLQLTRNLTFVIVRMIALLAAAALLHDAFGIGITASWVGAIPLSLLPVAVRLWLRREPLLPKPDLVRLRSLARLAAAHNWLNLAIQAPSLLIPVLVASILAPSTNAGFYAAWTISGVLFILPSHLSTVLFAVASSDPQVIAGKLRFVLRISLLLGLPAMAVLAIGAHPILSIFGAGYARVASIPMSLMVLGYIPGIPKFFYIAVYRALGKISRAAWLLVAFAALEVAAAVVGCLRDGLLGLSYALLIVGVIESFVTAPAVIRAATSNGRHRRAAVQSSSSAATVPNRHAPPATSAAQLASARSDYRERQLEAFQVLLSIASPGTMPMPVVPPDPDDARAP
jgi:O-antigen/teichoic acid export membrane protein